MLFLIIKFKHREYESTLVWRTYKLPKVKFIDMYSELGMLIDFAHNYYDGYSEDEIINLLGSKNIKGLHVSDARRGITFTDNELCEKTYMTIGTGDIDFVKLISAFGEISGIYSVLEINALRVSRNRR